MTRKIKRVDRLPDSERKVLDALVDLWLTDAEAGRAMVTKLAQEGQSLAEVRETIYRMVERGWLAIKIDKIPADSNHPFQLWVESTPAGRRAFA